MKEIITLLLCLVSLRSEAQQAGYAYNATTPVYYRSFGNGTPVLIINGGPGFNSDGFVALAEKLSGRAQAIIYDQRGTGRSLIDHPDSSNVTMQLMAEDIECLRRHLHVERWTILGHSFGGMLAAYYTSLYPDRVSSLILSSSGGIDLSLLSSFQKRFNARLGKANLDSMQYWDSRIKGGDTSYATKLGRGRAMAPAYVFNRKYIPQIAERLTQGNSLINSLVWADLQRIGFDCKKKFPAFARPVLVIQGKEDIIDPGIALTEQRSFPNARLVLMDHCVHYGWLDRPDIYLPLVEEFIAAGNR